MESDQRGRREEGQGEGRADDDRPPAARPWHRTPMEPEGPPPWTSSAPGEGVFGGGGEQAPPHLPGPQTEPLAPAGMPPAAVPPADAGPPPVEPPATPGTTEPPGAPPSGPRTGGSLARGIFLYIAATSLASGVGSLIAGARTGTGTAAAILGVTFVLLFFVAVMLRPGAAMDPVRATLGVVSVLFLVGCFALAVGAGDQGEVAGSTQLVRAAAAAGLFTLGMAGVGVLIPSAVASGLAMLGLVATVVLAAAAAGVQGFGLAVAALVAGVADLELAFRVRRLRGHPGATAWMVNLAGLLTGVAATVLGISFHGTAVASAGLAGAALAVVAWRWHAVVAAVAAVFPLTLVEGYVVVNATGSDTTAQGVAVLLVGLVLLVVVALVGMRTRDRVPAPRRRGRPVVDELLLVAAAAMALVALSEVGSGFTPFQGSPFAPAGGSFGGSAPEPVPLAPTFAPFPTFGGVFTPPARPTLPPG